MSGVAVIVLLPGNVRTFDATVTFDPLITFRLVGLNVPCEPLAVTVTTVTLTVFASLVA